MHMQIDLMVVIGSQSQECETNFYEYEKTC